MGRLLKAELEGLKSMKGLNSYDHRYKLFFPSIKLFCSADNEKKFKINDQIVLATFRSQPNFPQLAPLSAASPTFRS